MSPDLTPVRKPHAVLDLPSRRLKALKIEKLLDLTGPRFADGFKLLEVGCGTGGISHYFANHPDLACAVDAVDVVDQRQLVDGYRFQLVAGTTLPFSDGCFDVVITNHVIEHVGDHMSQAEHLHQIRRILKPGGKAYLAVPNRWQLVEPHYRLAFLSWLPRSLRTPYLKLAGKGEFYDCEPLTVPEVESLLRTTGFAFDNACIPALRLMITLEGGNSRLAALAGALPDWLLRPLRRIIPTLIYVLR